MRIAVVVKTTGIEFDDRVRKISVALSRSAEVKIFIVQDDNMASSGKTSYGIDYECIRLTTRDVLPRARFLIIKTLEFYFRLVRRLKDYDAIWYNEEKTFLFPLLASKSQVFIWDNHEIPMTFIKGWKRKIFQIIEKKAKKMLHANPQRINFLNEMRLLNYPEKHTFIHNYPDMSFVDSEERPSCYDDFSAWLGNEKYVYLQGLNTKARKPYKTIKAILEATNYRIIVVGSVDQDEKDRLANEFDELGQRVYFCGMVPQLSIPVLLRKAEFTIVLYDTNKPNNKYCEANRMYQAIVLGVPVIVGCNPSMKEVVEGKYGITLSSDGSNINELIEAIKQMTLEASIYKKHCQETATSYIWKDSFVNINWFN